MRKWVKFCINNNMKFIVYIVLLLLLPVYFLIYFALSTSEAWDEWSADFRDISKTNKGEV